MKLQSAILVASVLTFASGLSWGQGLRGPAPGGANGWSSSAHQRFAQPQFRSFHSPATGASSSHFTQGQNRGGVVVQHIAPPPFLAPSPRLITPRVAPHAPVHIHRPHHFPRRRGIFIIDVPRFYGTTVTVETLQGAGRVEQPLAATPGAAPSHRGPGLWAPFDPTPQEVVDRMLALAGVKKDDLVYDLGSGDGRIVIAVAKKYGARAVGIEIDPGLVKLARENVRKEGVENLVEIRQQDFMTADLSLATVVTLYLTQDGNLALRPKLMGELRPGARVVSYTFDMGDWQPKIMENYRDAANDMHTLYLWNISSPLASYEIK